MVGFGRICFRRQSGVRLSVLCRCVWQESGFSCREDVFTFNLVYKEIIFYFQLRFANNNSTINCIAAQQHTSILITSDNSYARLVFFL
jgi:hypothetical protein